MQIKTIRQYLPKRQCGWRPFSAVLLMAFMLVAGSRRGWAQEATASITGRITDATGAAVPGAVVSVTDVARGTSEATRADSDGLYRFPHLQVGAYNLKATASGMQSVVRNGIALVLNQVARVDLQMKVGQVNQTVEVSGAPPLLQTDTMQVGTVVGARTNVNLPLATRNFTQLTLLAPGVTSTDPSSFSTGQRTSGGGRPYVNGNREEANTFLLDGMDNNQVSDNLTSYQPSPDAIQEFNMITNNAPATFGNFQGGVINVSLKSGTNQFHGDVFEFFRNDKLNANSWANNWQGHRRAPVRWNMFGGTFGGPVVHDRIFFFGDYQGQRFDNPASTTSISVIPAAFRNGDFSSVSKQLVNPFTGQPFPNNQIPMGMENPVAKALFSSSQYAAPTLPGNQLNALNTTHGAINVNQGDIRIDARLNDASSLFFRYSESQQDIPSTNSYALLPNSFNQSPFHAGLLNYTTALSPSVTNELRVGFNRIILHNGSLAGSLGNMGTQLGIAGANDHGPGLPALQFTNGVATTLGSADQEQLFADTTYEVDDNMSILSGRHFIQTGLQFLRQDINTYYAGNNGKWGFLDFNGQYSGLSEADFFLGLPDQVGRGVNGGTWGQRGGRLGAYVQDSWRTTDNLTLNLGLRWDYYLPWVEVNNRQVNFSPYSGALEFPTSSNRALYNNDWKDWQPRLGFAWTPGFTQHTVIRGAYTMSSFLEGTGTNLRLPLNPPFNQEFLSNYTNLALPATTTDQGFSQLASPSNPFTGAVIRLWDPNVQPAIVQQWNLTIERQLPGNTVATVGYVGQHGTHLMVPKNWSQLVLQSDGTRLPSPYLAGNPSLAKIGRIAGTESDGNQRYDALQASLHRRFTSGLETQVSYTWSKGMTDALGYYGEGGQSGSNSAYWQNVYNGRAEWGPAYFDAKSNLTTSWVYELPVGRGKHWGRDWAGVADGALGGWQVSGILTFRSGFPLTIFASGDPSHTKAFGRRANCVGNPEGNQGVGLGNPWFNTAAFAEPASGTFGDCGNGVVRGPGYDNLDLNLSKSIHFTESRRLELRGDFLNFTNTPHFNAPGFRTVGGQNFGDIVSAQGERNIQLALKFYF